MMPMSEERLEEFAAMIVPPRTSNLTAWIFAVKELLAEVHRLRTLPPEVAAAMERVRPRLMRVGNWHVVEHEATTLTDLQIIAAHFTTLFKKGS